MRKRIKEFWRELRIRKYKHKKVRVLPGDPVKNYKLFFMLEIKSDGVMHSTQQVFDITIPARGYYYAKRNLDDFVKSNLNINVLKFESDTDI